MQQKNRTPFVFGLLFLGLCAAAAIAAGVFLWPSGAFDPNDFNAELTRIASQPARPEQTLITDSPAPGETALPSATNSAKVTAMNTVVPAGGPDWGGSPPEGFILFTCFVAGVDQICRMNADGTGRVQLTDAASTDFYASPSPDGKSFVFSSRRTGNFEIFWMLLGSGFTTQVTDGVGSLFAPEISPDGKRIVFANASGGRQSIWTMALDGSAPSPLTSGPGDDVDPTWSPDGSRIAFASSRNGARQLFIMDSDGSNIVQVTSLPNMGGRSSWSPDGTRLAFYAGPADDHDIYTINMDGSGLYQVTNGGDNLGPSWSPDGNWIAFTSFREGNNEIFIVRPDGSLPTNLTNDPGSDWQPRWGFNPGL